MGCAVLEDTFYVHLILFFTGKRKPKAFSLQFVMMCLGHPLVPRESEQLPSPNISQKLSLRHRLCQVPTASVVALIWRAQFLSIRTGLLMQMLMTTGRFMSRNLISPQRTMRIWLPVQKEKHSALVSFTIIADS